MYTRTHDVRDVQHVFVWLLPVLLNRSCRAFCYVFIYRPQPFCPAWAMVGPALSLSFLHSSSVGMIQVKPATTSFGFLALTNVGSVADVLQSDGCQAARSPVKRRRVHTPEKSTQERVTSVTFWKPMQPRDPPTKRHYDQQLLEGLIREQIVSADVGSATGHSFCPMRTTVSTAGYSLKIQSGVYDLRFFEKNRDERVYRCDRCGLRFKGGSVGRFCHVDPIPAAKFREAEWERGKWNATWFCISCHAEVLDRTEEQIMTDFGFRRRTEGRHAWVRRHRGLYQDGIRRSVNLTQCGPGQGVLPPVKRRR